MDERACRGPMKAKVWTNGASRPEEGWGAAAAVIEIEGVAEPFLYSELLPSATVNEAEYAAVILGLEKAREHGATEVVALTDSLLVVEQIRGKWECRAENLLPLLGRVLRLLEGYQAARVGWLPRERNRATNALVTALLRAG